MSLQVRVRSRGEAQGVRPLIFGPNCGPKCRKKTFSDRPIPLILRSGSANAGTLQRPSNFPITIVPSVASGVSRLNQPTYIILALRFNSSNWFCLRVMPFSSAVAIRLKLNTSFNVLSNKDSRISGVKRWCSGTVPEHRTLSTLTWSHPFFHIPTLRIRAGCQCPRRTYMVVT